MKEYFGVAKDMGVSGAEIEAIQSIVMAVSGGRVRAQFRNARTAAAEQQRRRE